MGMDDTYFEDRFKESLPEAKAAIGTLIRTLEEAREDFVEEEERLTTKLGGEVFVVHGHEEGVLRDVQLLLEQIKLPVVVLKVEPNKGRTIIEKFEH